jgi:hypothetical protein
MANYKIIAKSPCELTELLNNEIIGCKKMITIFYSDKLEQYKNTVKIIPKNVFEM